jgi:hypothetical protein
VNAIGVSALKMEEVFVGLWDVDEHPGEKLERVESGLFIDVVPGLGLVEGEGLSALTPIRERKTTRVTPPTSSSVPDVDPSPPANASRTAVSCRSGERGEAPYRR